MTLVDKVILYYGVSIPILDGKKWSKENGWHVHCDQCVALYRVLVMYNVYYFNKTYSSFFSSSSLRISKIASCKPCNQTVHENISFGKE